MCPCVVSTVLEDIPDPRKSQVNRAASCAKVVGKQEEKPSRYQTEEENKGWSKESSGGIGIVLLL